MQIVTYTPEDRQAWNAVCAHSDHAWFWHTREWFDFSNALLAKSVIADASFLVKDGGIILAVAPIMIISDPDQRSIHIGLGEQPAPWPAYSFRLGAKSRVEVERLIFAEYEKLALQHRVGRIELFGVVLAKSFYRSPFPPSNLPIRFGYSGTVFDTCVIDLTPPVEQLWRDVRKGHKSAIRTGQKSFRIHHWLGEISDNDFREYQELHALAAGRVTRAQATFDAMREWIRKGNGLLVGARDNDRWIGFVYMLLHQRGALYASACNHPDIASRLSVGHALLWEAIIRCREAGIELLEMGLQTYPAEDAAENDKLVSISRFKRGFGGFPMPRYQAHMTISTKAFAPE